MGRIRLSKDEEEGTFLKGEDRAEKGKGGREAP